MKIITIFSKFQLQFQNFSESLFTFIIRLFTAKGFLWLSELNVTLNINKVKKWFLQKVDCNSANYKMESIFMFAFAFVVCFLKGKIVLFSFSLQGIWNSSYVLYVLVMSRTRLRVNPHWPFGQFGQMVECSFKN